MKDGTYETFDDPPEPEPVPEDESHEEPHEGDEGDKGFTLDLDKMAEPHQGNEAEPRNNEAEPRSSEEALRGDEEALQSEDMEAPVAVSPDAAADETTNEESTDVDTL
eukprot:7456837-Pyramimonas_sp.AAC.1